MTISLDRYQELMTLPINAFNGLNKPDEPTRYACATIWKESNRRNLYRYIAQAQDMREKELGYYLTPTYINEELFPIVYNPVILSKKHLIALGKPAYTDIALAYAIAYTADPIEITITTPSVALAEVRVYKQDSAGTQYRVNPTTISHDGTDLHIFISRARLVNPDYQDDRDDHLDYYDDDNFVDTVDVIRVYTDPELAVIYEWDKCNTFTPDTHGGYGRVRDYRLSIIDTFPATWNAGVPSKSTSFCMRPNMRMLISYLSGVDSSDSLDLQTIRLAHSLMPFEPCTCEPVHQYWLNDVEPEPNHTITPYGSSVAAVFVWMADSRSKVGFGTTVNMR